MICFNLHLISDYPICIYPLRRLNFQMPRKSAALSLLLRGKFTVDCERIR